MGSFKFFVHLNIIINVCSISNKILLTFRENIAKLFALDDEENLGEIGVDDVLGYLGMSKSFGLKILKDCCGIEDAQIRKNILKTLDVYFPLKFAKKSKEFEWTVKINKTDSGKTYFVRSQNFRCVCFIC